MERVGTPALPPALRGGMPIGPLPGPGPVPAAGRTSSPSWAPPFRPWSGSTRPTPTGSPLSSARTPSTRNSKPPSNVFMVPKPPSSPMTQVSLPAPRVRPRPTLAPWEGTAYPTGAASPIRFPASTLQPFNVVTLHRPKPPFCSPLSALVCCHPPSSTFHPRLSLPPFAPFAPSRASSIANRQSLPPPSRKPPKSVKKR
jgi:hypothetical protein